MFFLVYSQTHKIFSKTKMPVLLPCSTIWPSIKWRGERTSAWTYHFLTRDNLIHHPIHHGTVCCFDLSGEFYLKISKRKYHVAKTRTAPNTFTSIIRLAMIIFISDLKKNNHSILSSKKNCFLSFWATGSQFNVVEFQVKESKERLVEGN